MKKKHVFATLAAGAVLALVPAAGALATTEYVGGGLWTYGTTFDTVYSNYHHSTKYHSATACNNGIIAPCYQASAVPDEWANASQPRSLWSNEAYWNTY